MRTIRTIECLDCNYEWDAEVFYCANSGMWDIVKSDDQQCHECGSVNLEFDAYR